MPETGNELATMAAPPPAEAIFAGEAGHLMWRRWAGGGRFAICERWHMSVAAPVELGAREVSIRTFGQATGLPGAPCEAVPSGVSVRRA